MSMTIEAGAGSSGRAFGLRLVRSLAVLVALLAGWIVAMAVVTALAGPLVPAVIVIGPTAAAGLPEGAGMLGGGPRRVIVTGEAPHFVRSLYASGAWLVLPALRNGCLDLGS